MAWVIRRLAWLFGALAIFAIGWWAGSYTSCSSSEYGCEVRLTAIDTVGTWVGGIGTIVALVLTMRAFQREQSEREAERIAEAAEAAAAEQEVLDQAQLVTVTSASGGHWGGGGGVVYPTDLRFTVHNGATSTTVFFVDCKHDEFGTIRLSNPSKIEPAGSSDGTVRFQPPNSSSPGPATDSPTSWGLEQAERVTLTYKMNDRLWRRRGSGRAVEVTD